MISVSKRIQLALEFTLNKHQHQLRKLSDTPYSVHPLSVAMLLMEIGESEDVIISALLHDTIEDTDTTYSEILELFGENVRAIVEGCSEHDKSLSWEKRKEHTIHTFCELSKEAQTVLLADKVHNLNSIKMNYEVEGYNVWNRFKRGYDSQKWYYGSLKKVFSESKNLNNKLLEMYNQLFNDVFGDE